MAISRRTFTLTASLLAATALSFGAAAHAQPVIGERAPDFTATTATGETVSLADFAGQTVMLEWTNHDCPFVVRHYQGNMQALQDEAAENGVVWIQVISSAPGEQGYVSAERALELNEERGASNVAHVFMDAPGIIGRAYDARTTPHMYVIDSEGTLRYNGGIDDQPRPRAGDPEPIPYAQIALNAVLAGEAVEMPETQPYGCNVKYVD
ncbi:redoxin domain-containing protein [Glycocaulis abyssi]|uniref:Redoxin domain-containing protein n=1 Tax=Glycocaulis abyssi TaxID=1433403 RepID=A0ABV9N9M1_9PROT